MADDCVNWLTASVDAAKGGRLTWMVRLGHAPLLHLYEDEALAQSLTEAFRARLGRVDGVPALLAETARFLQVQERDPMPETNGWLWNWFLSGAAPADPDRDWNAIRAEISRAAEGAIRALDDSEPAQEELAKRIERRLRTGREDPAGSS